MWERHITDPLGPLGANRETREESEQSIRTVQKATEHYEWVAQWRPWPPSYLVAFLPWVRARPRGKRAVGDWGSDQEPGDWRRLPFKEITMSLSEASVFQMERSRFAQSYKWLPFQQGEKTSPSLCWPKLSLPFPCQTFPFPRSESTKAGLGSDLRKTRFFFLFFLNPLTKAVLLPFLWWVPCAGRCYDIKTWRSLYVCLRKGLGGHVIHLAVRVRWIFPSLSSLVCQPP